MARHRDLPAVLVGSSSVGKSALLSRIQTGPFSIIPLDYASTVTTFAGKEVKLQIWTSTGSLNCRYFYQPICRIVSISLLMYDITDKSSFSGLDLWRNTVLQYAKQGNDEEIPMILVGNKLDLGEMRTVSWGEVETWARSIGDLPYFECSARTGEGVDEIVRECVSMGIRARVGRV